MGTRSTVWTVEAAAVDTTEAQALLRDYYIDVSDRYYQLHERRDSTPDEIEAGLAASPSDDLAVFLIAHYGGEPAGCAGLRVREAGTVELTRLFVRHASRGTGGGAQLLTAVDDAARSLGAEQIVLDTRLDLVEARALYLKHGYVEATAHTDRQYAEIWYRKHL